MKLRNIIVMTRRAEKLLAGAFVVLAERHSRNPEMRDMATVMIGWSEAHAAALEPFVKKYGRAPVDAPDRVRAALFHAPPLGGFGLLRDLQDVGILVHHVKLCWMALGQAAVALKDTDLQGLCSDAGAQNHRQATWIETHIKVSAPQALTVTPVRSAQIRASIPERIGPVTTPQTLWGPLMTALMIFVVGVLSVAAGLPWLVASLGPTAYMFAVLPAHTPSRFYHAFTSHLTALLMGFLAVTIVGAWDAPSVLSTGRLTFVRVAASGIALFLAILIETALRANHPPSAATALLVSLGSITTLRQSAGLMIGVVIVSLMGEAARRARLGGFALRRHEKRVRGMELIVHEGPAHHEKETRRRASGTR